MRLVRAGRFRWLDWDIENRPLSYNGPDYTTAEITAIAAGWVDEKKVHCWALGEVSALEMLTGFRELCEEADGLTGHNIRRHDLPITNGAMLEHGLPPLPPKLTCDTYADLTRRKELSASQASLAEMLGVPEAKYGMSQPAWREANRLTPEGVALTRRRVIDDVVQHRALRERLIERRLLREPRVWSP